ncbi:MAG TPA: hypothetical protein DIV86_02095 [Alphaproteobacteria bacterium]|nr:hypothetical protein [Alphaproteobacteria bacterium]
MFKKILKYFFILYLIITCLVGTFVISWPFIVLLYNGTFAPAPMPVYLPNGFIYDSDPDSKYYSKAILDEEKSIIIDGYVKDVMWYEDFIYGYRTGPAREPYYYICKYGDDCSYSQNYSEREFKRKVKEYKLPEYNSRDAHTYDSLLWEQSKTYKGKGG